MLISFLLPSARPQYDDAVGSWQTGGDFEFFLCLDKASDLEKYNTWNNTKFFYYDFEPGSPVQFWNELAKHAKGDMIVTLADDCFCATPNWLELILDRLPKFFEEPWVVYPNDRGEELATFL